MWTLVELLGNLKHNIKLYTLCYSVQYQEGQKRRKPNYSSVDLSEVEWEDKDDIVRAKNMSTSLEKLTLFKA